MEAASIPWRPIGELFVARGLISDEQLEQALAEQAATGMRLGEILVGRNLISSPELTEILMEQLGREVAKEDGFGSGLWAEIQRRTNRSEGTQLTVVPGEGGESPSPLAGEQPFGDPSEFEPDISELRAEFGLGLAEPVPQEELPIVQVQAELKAATRELEARETTIQLLRDELEQARARVDPPDRSGELEAEIDELLLAGEQARNTFAKLSEQLEHELHSAREELDTRTARIRELEASLADRELELGEAQRVSAEVTAQLATSNERLAHAESQAATAEQALVELKQSHSDTLDEQTAAADGRVAELERQLAALDNQLETAESSLHDERAAHELTWQQSEQAIASAAAAAERERDLALSELDHARSVADDLRKSLSEAEERARELEARASTSATETAVAQAALDEALQTSTGLEQQLAIALRRTEELDSLVASLEEQLEALRSVLTEECEAHAASRRQSAEMVERLADSSEKLEEAELQAGELAGAVEALTAERNELTARATREQRQAEADRAALVAELAEQAAKHTETRYVLALTLDELTGQFESPVVEKAAGPADYLCLVPGTEGYRLVARAGQVPETADRYELEGVAYVVTKVGRSPLPFDRRRCVYLHAA